MAKTATVSQDVKLKALQTAFKENEVLKELLAKVTVAQTKEIEQVVGDVLFDLAQEGKVKFADYGSFEIREQKGRANGRNPQTGEAMEIAPSKKYAFGQSATIKKELKK